MSQIFKLKTRYSCAIFRVTLCRVWHMCRVLIITDLHFSNLGPISGYPDVLRRFIEFLAANADTVI
jgi:hypothetical protein